jgi:hypothetical protein
MPKGRMVGIMTIMVNGMGRELKAVGTNGIEWTNDLLGNYGALHYEREKDQYTMTDDEFSWWEPVVEMLNEINDLEGELDDETREEYGTECWPNDIDDEAKARLEWLKEHVK